MDIVVPVPETGLEDNLPVAVKGLTNDLFSHMQKLEEEFKEAMGMAFYATYEADTNICDIEESTKRMLAKELVDVIFTANTFLASMYLDVKDRNDIFTEVYEKNKARGYYDLPKIDKECNENIKKVLHDLSHIVNSLH